MDKFPQDLHDIMRNKRQKIDTERRDKYLNEKRKLITDSIKNGIYEFNFDDEKDDEKYSEYLPILFKELEDIGFTVYIYDWDDYGGWTNRTDPDGHVEKFRLE